MVDAKVQVLIKPHQNEKLRIKARLVGFQDTNEGKWLNLKEISDRGLHLLPISSPITIEVIGLRQRLFFHTKVYKHQHGGILAKIPSELITVERRSLPRFNTMEDARCSINFSHLPVPAISDHIIMPFMPPYEDLALNFFVSDISMGGLCSKIRFPDAFSWLKSSKEILPAKILLPMELPLEIDISIRWHRKIKERNFENKQTTIVSIGVQFENLAPEINHKIKTFIRSISIKEAI